MQGNGEIIVRFPQKTVHSVWVYQELIPSLLEGAPYGMRIVSPHDDGNQDGSICVVHDPDDQSLDPVTFVWPEVDTSQTIAPDIESEYLVALLICLDQYASSIEFRTDKGTPSAFCDRAYEIAKRAIPDLTRPTWMPPPVIEDGWRAGVPDSQDFSR
ncbi:hypothetical protein [Marinobacter sp.]|uniref:hypothetical protein n=1 Tax=Marinobacter sp. TaxID=50741 RepID=UPI002615FF50|nr:hypothetical protein [Marinobacter sp.]